MKTLDWYILKKYLVTFIFCLGLFSIIVTMVDISEKANDFINTKLSLWVILRDYYSGFIPNIDAMLAPVFILVSVIFFTSKMASRSETVAILASGVSFKRMLFPFFLGSLILAVGLWWASREMLPRANQRWTIFDSKYIKFNYAAYQNTAYFNNYYFRLDSTAYAGIRYYDSITRRGNNFFVQRFKGSELKYNLRAETIMWDTATKKWRLEKVIVRDIDGLKEEVKEFPVMQVAYNFKPRDLQRDDQMKTRLTTNELNEYIRLEKLRGSENINALLIEKYSRQTTPVAIIILSLIGAIVAARKTRGGGGGHMVMGVLVCVLYIFSSRLTTVFSVKGNFTPWLAAWTPNIIFGLLMLYLYYRAPK